MLETVTTSLLDGLPIKTHYQTYTARDGVELAYQRFGTGTPLILIHGLGSSSLDWEFQYEELGEQYELIMPDLRGFGASAQAYFDMQKPGTSIDLFASDINDLMQHLNIKSCPVVGYSLGGAVAFQLAMNNLDNENTFNPSSLIIVNSLASFKIDSFKKFYLVNLRRVLARVVSMPRMAKIVSHKLFPDNPDLGDKLRARNSKNKKPPYIDSLNALIDWQIGPYLEKIAQATLFISADQDYTPPSEKQKSADMMQNARVEVIHDSRHGTPMDQPEKFNKAVLGFLLQRH